MLAFSAVSNILGTLLAIEAFLAAALLIVGFVRKRRRTKFVGGLLLSAVIPAAVMVWPGTFSRSRACLFVVPPGSEDATRRLITQLNQLNQPFEVAFARLLPQGGPQDISKLRWRRASSLEGPGALADISTALANASLAANPGWVERAARAARVWSPFIRATVVVPHAEDFSATFDRASVDVNTAYAAFQDSAAHFLFVDTSTAAQTGGQLELTLSAAETPRTALSACSLRFNINSHMPASGDYELDAWIDKSSPTQFEARLEYAFRKLSRLPAEIGLSSFSPDKPLKAGWHRLDVELSFPAVVHGNSLRAKFAASQYFRVVENELIVIAPMDNRDMVAHTWIHSVATPAISNPFVWNGGMLAKLFFEKSEMRRTGNTGRLPFSQVHFYSPAGISGGTEMISDDQWQSASMFLLMEPDAGLVEKLRARLDEYVKRGGTVVTVAPPAIASTNVAPTWLPYVGKPSKNIPSRPETDWGEARVYFLVDASRAANFSVHDLSLTDRNLTGTELQAEVVNQLYERFNAQDRKKTPVRKPLQSNRGLSLTAPGAQVVTFRRGTNSAVVIPPLIAGLIENRGSDLVERWVMGKGGTADIGPSWVSSRIWTLFDVGRSPFYNNALRPLAYAPANPWGISSADCDSPLSGSGRYHRTIVIAFAIEVPQPSKETGLWTDFSSTASPRAWLTTAQPAAAAPTAQLDSVRNLAELGVKVMVVPIQLDANLLRDYASAVSQSRSMSDKLNEWGATRVGFLELRHDNAAAKRSVSSVVSELSQKIQLIMQQDPRMKVVRPSRLVTLAAQEDTSAPRVWRQLIPANSNQPAPQVVISGTTFSNSPALVWSPVGEGIAVVLAYSPFLYEQWSADAGPCHISGAPLLLNPTSAAGWGMQRLCDPINLAARRPTASLSIEQIQVNEANTSAILDIGLPAQLKLNALPDLVDAAGKVAGNVVVSDVNLRRRHATMAISAGEKKELRDWYILRWASGGSKEGVFLNLDDPDRASHPILEALSLTATLSGGASLTEAGFAKALPDTFSILWLGATALSLIIIGLLSPLARVWTPWRLWRKRAIPAQVQMVDDQLEMEAAFNAAGMDVGTSIAQRPAGKVTQVRPMRPGDPALAAKKVDWGLFEESIMKSLGSPPMPRVVETPRLETLSITTILDLHVGAQSRDEGLYEDRRQAGNAFERGNGAQSRDAGLYEDRVRAMARTADYNAQLATRRGGMHRLLALQSSKFREEVEHVAADDVNTHIQALCRNLDLQRPRLPEIYSGEAVILVTDPASDIDELLPGLVRLCIEDRCPLAAVFLIHPEQRREVGLMRAAGSKFLVDRNDFSPSDIDRHFQQRIEHLSAMISLAEGTVAVIRSDQSAHEMVTVLWNQIWSKL